jgi:hypothetical protein
MKEGGAMNADEYYTEAEIEADLQAARQLFEEVAPLVAEYPPQVVSAVLGNLVARYLYEHCEQDQRQRRLGSFVVYVLGLLGAFEVGAPDILAGTPPHLNG